MKQRAVAFLAACAVTLVASCASAPRAAPVPAADRPLTIELFDSRAMSAVWSASGRTAGQPRLSLPAIPEDAAPAPVAGAAEIAAREPAHAEPDAAAGLDASLRSPLRPLAKASFQLAAPLAPLAAIPAGRQGAVGAPAARQVPAKPAPGKPAPARPAAPGGTPAASIAPAPPAASAPSAAPAPSAVAAQSASPYGRLREIYARQGDELQIGLDGVGFLFLGLPDAQVDGMSFKSKENRNARTLFTFQALKLGTYDLDFLQQDNMAGKTSRETVRVHVVTDLDFAAATAGQQGPQGQAMGPAGASPSTDSGDPVFAQKLASAGSYPAAVAELLKGYREGDPGLNDQIAALYMRMGSYEAAGKYWTRNLAPQSDFTSRAVVGLFRVSVLQNDQQALLTYLRPFLALNDAAMEEPLIQAVRMEKGRAENGLALDLAAEYARRFPNGSWRDEADFLTAQLLEADSQFRDLARARQLYFAILADRPESPFADNARRRIQYIDRHFFDVR